MYQELIILLFFAVFMTCIFQSCEPYSATRKIADVSQNKDMFIHGAGLNRIKSRMRWMDPIYYYDLTKMGQNGELDNNAIHSYFTS